MRLCRALAPDATDPGPARMLALLLAERAKPDEALAWAERALALDRGDAHSWAALARVRLRAGTLADAERAFGEALTRDPRLGSALGGLRAIAELERRRGQALFGARQWSAAAAAFTVAVRCRPDAAAWHDLGAALHEAGRHPAAQDAYRAALALAPDRVETWHNLGAVLQALRDVAGAMTAYGRAYRLKPGSFPRIAQELAAGNPGRVWLDAGDLRRALSLAADGARPADGATTPEDHQRE